MANVFVDIIAETIISIVDLVISGIAFSEASIETNTINVIFIGIKAHENSRYVFQIIVNVNEALRFIVRVVVRVSMFIYLYNDCKTRIT